MLPRVLVRVLMALVVVSFPLALLLTRPSNASTFQGIQPIFPRALGGPNVNLMLQESEMVLHQPKKKEMSPYTAELLSKLKHARQILTSA